MGTPWSPETRAKRAAFWTPERRAARGEKQRAAWANGSPERRIQQAERGRRMWGSPDALPKHRERMKRINAERESAWLAWEVAVLLAMDEAGAKSHEIVARLNHRTAASVRTKLAKLRKAQAGPGGSAD